MELTLDGKLTTAEAAERLKVTPRLLSKLRERGRGPAYRRIGRAVYYDPEDIARWVRQARRETVDSLKAMEVV